MRRIVRSNCYWYNEWHDMGATVSQCSKASMGMCPCDECTTYISQTDARKLVEAYQEDKMSEESATVIPLEKLLRSIECCLHDGNCTLCPLWVDVKPTNRTHNDCRKELLYQAEMRLKKLRLPT